MKKEISRDEFQKKRMERQKKIRKRRLTAFFIMLIILTLSVGVTLCLTVFFPIENIIASGSKIYSAEQILKEADVKSGDNLFTANQSKTEKALKSRLPYIESVTFERQLPNTLVIKVKDATEFASYKVGERYFTVSKEGWVLEETVEAKKDLFTVSAKDIKCKVGTMVQFGDKSQKDLIDEISDTLKEKGIETNLIDVSNTLEIKLKVANHRFVVELGTSNNIKEKIYHLAGMIEEISLDKKGKINLTMWTNDNTKGTFVAEN